MNRARELPVWRSSLIVPANVERFVAKAPERGADALVIDLEDSIPLADKNSVRDLIPGIVRHFRAKGHSDVMVRINQPLDLAVRDLESSVIQGVDALVIPKVEGPDHLSLLDELVTRLELSRGLPPGKVWFLGLLEAPGPLTKALAIARSTPRLAGIALGAEDYATAIGAKPSQETLSLPAHQIVQAACASGILPLGTVGSLADFTDLDEYARIVRNSADYGFVGAACIHPSQVPILNAGFSPSALDIENAERIVSLAREAAVMQRGSFAVGGRMIDMPVLQRAEGVLARARAIAERMTSR
jgi:citrate lyase subunit beta / citryl-CoA lyase